MTMFAAITATPAAAALSYPMIHEASNAAEWDAAFASYEAACAPHDAAWSAWEEAEDRFSELLPPRPAHIIDRCGVNSTMDPEAIKQQLRRRGLDDATVESLAAEYAEFRRAWEKLEARFNTKKLFDIASSTNPAFLEARDALMRVSAPTLAALLIKIELSTRSMDEDHAESTLADARRLLGDTTH